MDFQSIIADTRKLLGQGSIDAARARLDDAWKVAGKDKDNRKVAHDMGNQIQAAIFDAYLAVN